jgi:hypothetical protein
MAYPWEAFSDRARRAIALAHNHAHRLGKSEISVSDLKIAAQKLAKMTSVPKPVKMVEARLPFSLAARRVLKRIAEEYARERNPYIGVEHLLAACD